MQRAHFFYAVSLPDGLKQEIAAIQQELRSRFPFKSWVHPMDCHITLAFLGGADEIRLGQANENILQTIGDIQPFEVSLERFGIFGREQAPKVFWIKPDAPQMLFRLRDTVYAACTKAGFQLETRPFSPHITLARKWISEEAYHPGNIEQSLMKTGRPLSFKAEEAVLYRTHLDRSPKYEKVTAFKL